MPCAACSLLSPALILISLPLAIFAALTTTLAFSTLFFRALIVYAELAAVLIQNPFNLKSLLVPPSRDDEGSSSSSTTTASRATLDDLTISIAGSNRLCDNSSGAVSSSSGCGSITTPKTATGENYNLSGGGSAAAGVFYHVRGIAGITIGSISSDQRDFEGVGGWSMEDSGDEDHVPWTGMNARLELPTLVDERLRPNNHRRSLTSTGSLRSLIPIPIRSPFRPGFHHARTP